MAEVIQNEEQMTYIDFKKERVNPRITLSIVESGKTVESIKRREKIVHIVTTIFTYIFILALALTVMFPFYWMIITSLKQNNEIMAAQQTFFPNIVMWSNYVYVFETFNFTGYMFNTIIVAIFSTAGTLLTTIFAAFAFARLEFKGREALFMVFLMTMMIPGEMMVISNYLTVNAFGWINDQTRTDAYLAMIVPFVVSVFHIYLLRQNFKQNVVLQFNDPTDYSSVIPGVRKKEPSKVYGRGLILLDGIFEFQTAYAYHEEKMTDYIKIICDKLNSICEYKAHNIPILPEVVNQAVVGNYLGNIRTIPVGIEKETLNIATINFTNTYMYNITGEDISSEPNFIKGFIKNILTIQNSECIIFDTNNILSEVNYANSFYSKDSCYQAIDKLNEAFLNNNPNNLIVAVIININTMLNKLSTIEKGKFTTLISQCKEKENIKIIIIDNIDSIKAINFEPWYKGNVNLAEGVWIGNGIGNQFTLRVTTNSRILRTEVAPGFGYIIRKGKAELIKLMSDE